MDWPTGRGVRRDRSRGRLAFVARPRPEWHFPGNGLEFRLGPHWSEEGLDRVGRGRLLHRDRIGRPGVHRRLGRRSGHRPVPGGHHGQGPLDARLRGETRQQDVRRRPECDTGGRGRQGVRGEQDGSHPVPGRCFREAAVGGGSGETDRRQVVGLGCLRFAGAG